MSILESGKFRLYDKFKQTDPNEFSGTDIFLEKLKGIKAINSLTHHFVDVYEDTLPSALKDFFFWGIGSFTRIKSNERHWDEYAQNRTGVRFEFSSVETNWAAPHEKQTRMFDYCMHYDEAVVSNDQAELVGLITRVLCQEMAQFDPLTATEILKELSICISPGVIQHALFYKEARFSWEEEVRVLVAGDVELLENLLSPKNGRRFIEVPLFPLRSIAVGSNATSETAKLLNSAAAKYGISVQNEI